jgi:hypothetical protein
MPRSNLLESLRTVAINEKKHEALNTFFQTKLLRALKNELNTDIVQCDLIGYIPKTIAGSRKPILKATTCEKRAAEINLPIEPEGGKKNALESSCKPHSIHNGESNLTLTTWINSTNPDHIKRLKKQTVLNNFLGDINKFFRGSLTFTNEKPQLQNDQFFLKLALELASCDDESGTDTLSRHGYPADSIEDVLQDILPRALRYLDPFEHASWLIWASSLKDRNHNFDHVFSKPSGKGRLYFTSEPDKNEETATGKVLQTKKHFICGEKRQIESISSVAHLSMKPACIVAIPVIKEDFFNGVIGVFSDRYDIINDSFIEFIKLAAEILSKKLSRRIQRTRLNEAGLSHDFAPSIDSLKSGIEALKEVEDKEELLNRLTVVINMKEIFCARPGLVFHDKNYERVNIRNLAVSAIRSAGLTEGYSNADAFVSEFNCDGDERLPVYGPALFIVLYNLVKNAIKHGHRSDNGFVAISFKIDRSSSFSNLVITVDSPAKPQVKPLTEDQFSSILRFGYDASHIVVWPKAGERTRYGLRLCNAFLDSWRLLRYNEVKGKMELDKSRYARTGGGNCIKVTFPFDE